MIDFLSRAFGGDKSGKPRAAKRINLALQGGGAHGAFTWGVLDHLLEDGRLAVEGISGTSAGAVNAVMLADGLRARPGGSAQAACRFLARDESRRRPAGGAARGDRTGCSRCCRAKARPGFDWLTAWSRYLSPYDVNPLNINPLKDLVERFVDFERLARRHAANLHRRHQCADRPPAYFSA